MASSFGFGSSVQDNLDSPGLYGGSLARLREVLYESGTTLDVIVDEYKAWVGSDRYLVFEQSRFHSPVRQIASLVAKRGNSKYAFNVKKRFEELIKPFELNYINDVFLVDGRTSVLYLTLTYDPKRCDFKSAWCNIGVEVNRYLSDLKRCFQSRVLIVARTFEAFRSGFVHVHLILYFQDCSFHTFKRFSKKSGRDVWRIDTSERDKFRGYWHSNIDVQGMENMRVSLRYLEKYIAKASNLALNDSGDKGLKTLALSWGFGKRSYSVSRKFKDIVFERYLALPSSDLTSNSVTQTFSEQLTLSGEVLRDCQPEFLKPFFEKWSVRGIVDKLSLKRYGGIPRGCFSFGLCDGQKEFVSWYFGDND